VKKDLKTLEPGVKWREAAENRDRWQDLYLKAETKKEEEEEEELI